MKPGHQGSVEVSGWWIHQCARMVMCPDWGTGTKSVSRTYTDLTLCLLLWIILIWIFYSKTVIITIVLPWVLYHSSKSLNLTGGCGTPRTCSQLVSVPLNLQLSSEVRAVLLETVPSNLLCLPLTWVVSIRIELHRSVPGGWWEMWIWSSEAIA